MIRFFVALLVTAVGIAGLTMLAMHLSWIPALPSFFYQTLLFLLFGTFVIFRYLFRTTDAELFVRFYLLSMALKFIAYGAYNLIVVLEDRAGASGNVVFFLVVYVLFTALEVVFLYRRISRSGRP